MPEIKIRALPDGSVVRIHPGTGELPEAAKAVIDDRPLSDGQLMRLMTLAREHRWRSR